MSRVPWNFGGGPVAVVDESFRDGERFFKVALADLRPSYFIRAHLAASLRDAASASRHRLPDESHPR